MNIHKRNVFGLYFLVYFAVYAVSPIVYTISVGRSSEIVSAKADACSCVNNFQTSLLETVLQKLIPGEEEQPDSSAVKFIIRKKRAVLPEDRLARTPYPDTSPAAENASPFLSAPLSGRISGSGPNPAGRDHQPLYLCHSPPASQMFPA